MRWRKEVDHDPNCGTNLSGSNNRTPLKPVWLKVNVKKIKQQGHTVSEPSEKYKLSPGFTSHVERRRFYRNDKKNRVHSGLFETLEGNAHGALPIERPVSHVLKLATKKQNNYIH